LRGRIAAVEILKSTPRTREYIENGEAEGKSLLDAMRDGKLDGMQDFDGVIKDLIERKVITGRRRPGLCDQSEQSALVAEGLTSGEDFIRTQSQGRSPQSSISPASRI
jgi:twitching motility protein PilT